MHEEPKGITQTHFVAEGDVVRITQLNTGNMSRELPTAIYNVMYNKYRNEYYLTTVGTQVSLPEVLNTGYEAVLDKVLNKYRSTEDKATGAIFAGPAGVGKSIASKMIQDTFLREYNLPVVIVPAMYTGQVFMDCINKLGDCLLVFDEFDKFYSAEDLEQILSLFDGNDSSQKRLSLLIVNDDDILEDYVKNRTGRANYYVVWESLSVEFIIAYMDKNLIHCKHKDRIIDWAERVDLVTFDNLESLVSEVNMYPEDTWEEVTKFLNIRKAPGVKYYRVLKHISPHGEMQDIDIVVASRRGYYIDFSVGDLYVQAIISQVRPNSLGVLVTRTEQGGVVELELATQEEYVEYEAQRKIKAEAHRKTKAEVLRKRNEAAQRRL